MTDDFALVSPALSSLPVTKGRRPRRAGYTDHDHQWLIDLCSRHITLREYRRLARTHNYFKDYPTLLGAAVVYFGYTQLGWSMKGSQKKIGYERRYMTKCCRLIEDMRHEGEAMRADDVFDRIELQIRGACNGLI